MSRIDDLKQAVAKLEVDLTALSYAERELSNWKDHDRNRRDGSSAQDARHEEIGQNARMDLRDAKDQVESQKTLIASIATGI